MTKTIDCFGKACPLPLVTAKKQIDAGERDLAVKVDNETAVKNLTRLAQKKGMGIDVEAIEGGWQVTFCEGDGSKIDVSSVLASTEGTGSHAGSGYCVFVSKDHLGEGEGELGRNLIKMAIYTLTESDEVPVSLLFMNSGVKLVAGEEPEVVENVKRLEERGTEVLVCGTCLNFYGIADKLEAGEVSNMYDILSRMQESSNTITL